MTATDAMLLAYVDGELDPAGVREVERVLLTDPQAQRTVEMYRESAALLRAACSDSVYAAGAAQLLPPATARRWPRRRLAWAAAACLAVGVSVGAGGFWVATQPTEMASLIDEIVEYHEVFSRETDHLAEVPAARAQELTAWLGARLQRPLPVPDLAAEGLHFAGGRMLVVDGAPVAQFMYTRAQGRPIAVCVDRMEGGAQPVEVERHGRLRVAAWRQDGYAYVVVGEMTGQLARAVAAKVQAQLGV